MHEPTDILTALIVETPMCLPCIAKNGRMMPEAAAMELAVICRAVRMRQKSNSCQSCGAVRTVYSIERQPQSASNGAR